MRLHRFYVSQPLGEEVVIDDVSILKQWSKVFRYKKGDFVILFNGDGTDVTFSIDTLFVKSATLLRKEITPAYIPPQKITLYLSVIKKDNFELVAQKATELGVSAIIPIITERSEKKSLHGERLQKIIIEASEQCGRGDIPTLLPIVTLHDVFAIERPHTQSFVLQMNGIPFQAINIPSLDNVSLFIGPEGGWSPSEEQYFQDNGCEAISLGKTTLRAETAAILACGFALQ
jgi:16S rRNA (uracil1498-N3)-methyltransferase